MTTLEQIIQKLKTTRESKGLTIEQICEKTKIPLHQLEGLEEGRFDELPEPIYVAGFIKLYAAQIGLNGQLLANEYREWSDSENPRMQMTGNKKRIKSAPDVPIIVSDDYFQKNKIETSPPTFKTIYFNLIMIVLVLGLVSYLGMTQFNNYSNQLEGNNVVTPQTKSATPAPDTGLPVAPSQNQLMLSANKHVWVEVKSAATGDNLYIGFLEPGNNKIFDTPEQGLRIRATDGGDVNISYQGKVAALGIAGQETEKVFAPGSVPGISTNTASTATTSTPAATTSTTTPVSGSATTTSSATGTVPTTSALGTTASAAAKPTTATVATPEAAAALAARRRRWAEAATLRKNSAAGDGQSYKYGEGRLDSE